MYPSLQLYDARLSNVVPPIVLTLPFAGSGNFPQSTTKHLKQVVYIIFEKL